MSNSFSVTEKVKNFGLVNRYLNTGRFFPLFEIVVMVYAAFTIITQVLLQISPFMTFLAKTPFYSIQTLLGLFGAALIVIDFFTNKTIWKGKYCYLLIGILVLAAIASVRMISYGTKENIFKLCWAAIQFTLFYSLAHRVSRETLKKYITGIFATVLTLWLVACVYSLYQFVFQIGYWEVVNPLALDSSANRQGFFDNRLFGIFYTLNHAAYVSLILFLIGLLYIIKTKKILVRIALVVSDFILLCHILLSGSRSALVSFVAAILFISWLLLRRKINIKGFFNTLLPVLLAIVIAVSSLQGALIVKKGLAKVPAFCESFIKTEQVVPPNENVLHRENLEDDQSNGRFDIWSDYIKLYKQVGLVGLSPGNYMPYIHENHQDLYIVDYIKEHYPDKYDSGFVHHVHNGFIMVYVSAGILGIILLAIFMVLCIRKVFAKIKQERQLSYLFICSFVIVVVGAISAVFDEGLFFQNNPHTTAFWLALGILMKEACKTKEKGNS